MRAFFRGDIRNIILFLQTVEAEPELHMPVGYEIEVEVEIENFDSLGDLAETFGAAIIAGPDEDIGDVEGLDH